MSQAPSAPPPSHQEIARKLSLHSAVKPIVKKPALPVSGTESDSDSGYPPEGVPTTPVVGSHISGTSSQPPLSSIAERRTNSGGEESEEDDDDDDGGWRAGDGSRGDTGALEEAVIKTGYLWKKGERRKTWKKRWFVLRPAHLAFYKTDKEYKLLRLLDLGEIHSCTPVALKKHANTFGLVSPVRTFYLQAVNPQQVQAWVKAINDAREALLTTSTQNSVTAPIAIPIAKSDSKGTSHIRLSSSPSQSPYALGLTSSESEDASPSGPRSVAMAGTAAAQPVLSEVQSQPRSGMVKDPPKVILSGYLMKCGSRRHNWHKRWFVLSGEKLIYSRSHMDTKPHREIPLAQILDALEYDLPQSHRSNNSSTMPPPTTSLPSHSSHSYTPGFSEDAGAGGDAYSSSRGQACRHTFKVVTMKRTLLLCAPSEEEEIKWLSAVRALIARRSGAGVVPGDVDGFAQVQAQAHAQTYASNANPNANAHATTLLGSGSGGGGGGGGGASSSSNANASANANANANANVIAASGPIPISDAGQVSSQSQLHAGVGTGAGSGLATGSIASASMPGPSGANVSSSAGHHQYHNGRRRGESFVRRLSLGAGGGGSSGGGSGGGGGGGSANANANANAAAAGSGVAGVGTSSGGGTIVASAPTATSTVVPQEAASGRQS